MELKSGQKVMWKDTKGVIIYSGIFDEAGCGMPKMYKGVDEDGDQVWFTENSVIVVPLIDWDKIKADYQLTLDSSDLNGQEIHGMCTESTFDWFKEKIEAQLK